MKKTGHPVQLPDSLINKWLEDTDTQLSVQFQEAAQWGSDQELEACCEWIPEYCPWDADKLRAARRPKQSSLKELALMALEDGDTGPETRLTPNEVSIIRLALEALPE
jgi:hypothetical protein